MYVCLCKGITEKQVQEAVNSRKNQSVQEVLKRLGLGSDCGTCVEDTIKKFIGETNHPPHELKSTHK